MTRKSHLAVCCSCFSSLGSCFCPKVELRCRPSCSCCLPLVLAYILELCCNAAVVVISTNQTRSGLHHQVELARRRLLDPACETSYCRTQCLQQACSQARVPYAQGTPMRVDKGIREAAAMHPNSSLNDIAEHMTKPLPARTTCACCQIRSSYLVVMPRCSLTCDKGHWSPSLHVPVLWKKRHTPC